MKKKGLIISTIVMVVVLIASLTTATYAWFNSNAEARVENISIMTVTNDGLQVSVVKNDGSTYVSGDITYENNDFVGSVEDWGTVVNFSEISADLGEIANAVTRVSATDVSSNVYKDKVFVATTVTNDTYAAAVSSGLYYAKETEGATAMTLISSEGFDANIAYFTKGTDPTEGAYLSPIGYNTVAGVLTPYGYTVANRNGEDGYLDLPIAVRATDAMKAVLCSMTITPQQGTAAAATWNNYKPGMAAAIRIRISDGTNTVEVQPYLNVIKSGSAFANATDTAFVLDFVVAHGAGTTNVTALDALKLTYTIWIEGTDGQCIDIVTGTGAQVDLAYSFIASDDTTATWTAISTAQTLTDASVSYTSEPSGKLTYATKDYYVFSFSKAYNA